MIAKHDLNSQQQHLSSTSYDLRITNLARFLYKYAKRVTCNAKRPKLLDVGAGNGLLLKFFKAQGFEISGFELEKKNVENIKKDPLLKNENIHQGDITKLEGNQEYDVVIASDVIEHIKDDILAIQNLWSFVKPNGILIITVPAHSFLFGMRDVKWGHFRRYDQKLLLDIINKAISDKTQIVKRETFEIEFATEWNSMGFFVYFLFEKILHKPINETMRYSDSFFSKLARYVLELILRIEEYLGGVPLGLTLIVGIKKLSNKR